MPYLFTKDYERNIQSTELNQLTGNSVSTRQLVETSVEAEIRSYLIQKYDLSTEFLPISAFAIATIYKPGYRVYLDASAYSAAATYALGALTLYAGNVYKCTTAITLAEAFTIAHWTLIGAQYAVYFVKFPQNLFDEKKYYYKGDQVFWKDKTYTAVKGSSPFTHEEQLQAVSQESIHSANVYPDDRNTAAARAMWGTGTAYTVAAGTLPSDATKWTCGDNRNQLLIEVYLDMVVYNLCKRIAPNNVPEARHNSWVRAVEILKNFAKGNITAELPVIQPRQGSVVRFGGDVKRINNY